MNKIVTILSFIVFASFAVAGTASAQSAQVLKGWWTDDSSGSGSLKIAMEDGIVVVWSRSPSSQMGPAGVATSARLTKRRSPQNETPSRRGPAMPAPVFIFSTRSELTIL